MSAKLPPGIGDTTPHDERLIEACKRGNINEVRQSLPLANVFCKLGQPMQWAVQFGHLDIVQELWPHYQDSSQTEGLLNMAAWHGHAEVVEFFMPHLARPKVVTQSIEEAVEQNHVPVLRILAQYPDVEVSPLTLFALCANDQRELIDVLYPRLDQTMLANFLNTEMEREEKRVLGWYLYHKYQADQQAAVLKDSLAPQLGRMTGRAKL